MAHCLKVFEKFRGASLLRTSKLAPLNGKNLACFSLNLVQNFMIFSLEATGSDQKMAKT